MTKPFQGRAVVVPLLIVAAFLTAGALPGFGQVPGRPVPYVDLYAYGNGVQGYASTEYECWECFYLYDVFYTTDVTATLSRGGVQVDSRSSSRFLGTASVYVEENPAPPSTSYELRGNHGVSVEWKTEPGGYPEYGYEVISSADYYTTPARAPRIDSITPDWAYQGDFGVVMISGADFDSSAYIAVSGAGVSMSVLSVATDGRSLSASYTIAPDAWPTSYNVTVTTAGGTSNAAAFWVYQPPPPPPNLTGIIPDQNFQCGSGYIEIYGHNLSYAPVVSMSGSGVSISNTYVSDLQVNVRYAIQCAAAPGARSLTVTTPYGTSNAATFTIKAAKVEFTATDIQNDYVDVRLSGTGSGTLRVELSGDGISRLITDGSTYSQGTHRFNIGRDSLPVGMYRTYTATWVIPGGYITDETRIYGYANANFEIRDVNHTRYNTTYESFCTGPPALAYTTVAVPACAFSSTTMKSDFIYNAERNGTGVSIVHGPVQKEWLCMSSPSKPVDADGRSFRPGPLVPKCEELWLGNDTIAVHDQSGVTCGQKVILLSPGGGVEAVKTATDRCPDRIPGCADNPQAHFDNYSTAQCCGWSCSPTIGSRRTIILR